MASTRTREKPAGASRERPRSEANLERDLAAASRRHAQRSGQLEEAAAERDRVIRDAMAAGITRPRIAEITGLSVPRLEQIRKGTR